MAGATIGVCRIVTYRLVTVLIRDLEAMRGSTLASVVPKVAY